jgi:hypothetical protein
MANSSVPIPPLLDAVTITSHFAMVAVALIVMFATSWRELT